MYCTLWKGDAMVTLGLEKEFKEFLAEVIREVIPKELTNLQQQEKWLTIDEVLEILGVCYNTFWKYADGLPIYQLGNKKYVKQAELNEFLEAHQIK